MIKTILTWIIMMVFMALSIWMNSLIFHSGLNIVIQWFGSFCNTASLLWFMDDIIFMIEEKFDRKEDDD